MRRSALKRAAKFLDREAAEYIEAAKHDPESADYWLKIAQSYTKTATKLREIRDQMPNTEK